MSLPRWLRAVPLLALVAAGGCSDDGGEGASPEPEPTEQLEGRELLITSVTDGGTEDPRADEREALVRFSDGQVHAAGCNNFSGPYEFDGEQLVIEGMGGTEMWCGEELHALDEWLVAVLSATHQVTFDGDEVLLTSGSTTIELIDREAVRPNPPLVGTVWVLDTLIEGNGASSIGRDVVATVTFAEDGTFDVDTGCNTGSGDYEQIGPTTLEVGGVATTAIGCDGQVAEAEAALLAVFAPGAVEVSIGDRDLILLAGDVGAGFHPAPGLAEQLDGRTFVGTELEGADERFDLVEGTEVQVTFDGGTIGVLAGCNPMGGEYAVDGDLLVVDELAMDPSGCAPSLLVQGELLVVMLTHRPTLTLVGGALTIDGGGLEIVLTEQ